MRFRVISLVVASFALVVASASPGDPAAELQHRLELLSSSARPLLHGEPVCATNTMARFYAMRGYQPAWSNGQAAELLGVLERIDAEGLDSADYHVQTIARLLAQKDPGITTAVERDLLLTDAFAVAAHDLLNGRVDPVTIIPTWCLDQPRIDLAAVLDAALEFDQVEQTLIRLTSRDAGYHRLRDALVDYRRIAAAGGWPAISTGPSLRAGDASPRLPELRDRLAHDSGASLLSGVPEQFDASVDAAVRAFQARHGIDPDGVVGPATLRELNVTVDQRIEQIVLNLERWRWLPSDLGSPHVLVNLAGFSLDVVDKGAPMLTMRVIVGKDFRETPVFSSSIEHVVLNPYWNVPTKIATEEILPKARGDRTYLRRNHIAVINGKLRQDPGPWNPLGRIKFNMPNPHAVYLHDTPAPELFQSTRRTFSHGCIRIEKAEELAVSLLREEGWTPDRIDQEILKDNEKWIPVSRPVPVHVLYWTSWVAADGSVHFTPDIYGRDPVLSAALRRRPSAL